MSVIEDLDYTDGNGNIYPTIWQRILVNGEWVLRINPRFRGTLDSKEQVKLVVRIKPHL